jgi:hypothetical protein
MASVSSESDSSDYQWEISEILAERTSVRGENEVLVVWKSCWIGKSQLKSHGPVEMAWKATRKWQSPNSSGIVVRLAAETGSNLSKDMAHIAATAAENRDSCSGQKRPKPTVTVTPGGMSFSL